jgi:hypothetical protein
MRTFTCRSTFLYGFIALSLSQLSPFSVENSFTFPKLYKKNKAKLFLNYMYSKPVFTQRLPLSFSRPVLLKSQEICASSFLHKNKNSHKNFLNSMDFLFTYCRLSRFCISFSFLFFHIYSSLFYIFSFYHYFYYISSFFLFTFFLISPFPLSFR